MGFSGWCVTVTVMRDAERLISNLRTAASAAAWLSEAAVELERAHHVLDDEQVPRVRPESGKEMTLAARIHYLVVSQKI